MKRKFLAAFAAASLFVGLQPEPAFANPQGGVVIGGDATATISGEGTANVIINQFAENAVINWQDFSVQLGELTRFVQPGANAAALNRVLGGNPSQLLGSLQANGQIYLVNPNGILVGSQGSIDSQSFIASTLDISNESFLGRANMTFEGDSRAAIENYGSINALGGDIFLFAHQVKNEGTISALGGTVGLAAGNKIELRQVGNERIGVIIDNPTGEQTEVGVDNQGVVEAASAEIKAAGGNVYAVAINNGGEVRAEPKLVFEGGRMVIKSEGGTVVNTGTLDASNDNGKGGSISVEGAQVGMAGDAVVDASGATGGGSVNIGGGFQGNDSNFENALRTYVGPAVTINADATVDGDGGEIIVWSDEVTRYHGTLSATGSGSGAGGFAEISGYQNLVFQGAADVSAASGASGLILLDPSNVTIQTAGANDADLTATGIDFSGAGGTGTPATFSVAAIEGLTGSFNIQAHNNISIDNALSLSQIATGETATFTAGDSITIAAGANITTAGGGNLLFIGSDVGGVDAATAAINVNATVGAATTASVTFQNGGSGGININAGGNVTALSLISFNGALNLTGTTTFTAGTVSLEDVSGAAEDLIINGTGQFAGTANLQSVTVNGATTLAAANTMITTSGAQFYSGAVQLLGDGTLAAGAGMVTFGSSISGDVAGRSLTIGTTGSTVFSGQIGSGAVPLGSLAVNNAGPVSFAGNVTTSGAQDYSGAATLATDVNFTSTGGTVTFASTVDGTTHGMESLTTTGNASFGADVGGTIRPEFVTVTGDTSLGGNVSTEQAGGGTGNQTYNGAVTLTGNTILTAITAGNISMNNTVDGNFDLSVVTPGTTTFGGVIGGMGMGLASVTTDMPGTTSLAGSVTTTGNQTYNDPITVTGSSTLTGADITFAGTANTANPLAIIAGEVVFGGGAGSVSGTSTLRIGGNAAAGLVGITVGGAADGLGTSLELNVTDLAALAEGFTSITIGESGSGLGVIIDAAGASFADPLTINSDGAGGSVTINGQLDTLANMAGPAATITINGTGMSTTLSADIVTDAAMVTINDAVSVDGARTIDTAFGGAGAGAVTITGAIDGANIGGPDDLTILADDFVGGTAAVDLQTAIGGADGLEILTVNGGQVDLPDVTLASGGGGAITINGSNIDLNGTTYTAGAAMGGGTISFDGGNVDVLGGATTFTGVSVSFDQFNAGVSLVAGANDITFVTDSLVLGGGANSVTGTGAVAIEPGALATSITVGGTGGAGSFNIDDTVIAAFANGFSGISIGAVGGTLPITVNASGASFADSLTLNADGVGGVGGSVAISGTLDTLALNGGVLSAESITINGTGTSTTLSADITTAGGDVAVNDRLIVDSARTIDTTNGGASNAGSVTVTGAIDGANAAGTDTLNVDANGMSAAAIDLQGNVGQGTQDVEGLTVDGAQIDLENVVVGASGIDVTGTTINLNSTTYTATGGPVDFVGPVNLLGGAMTTVGSTTSTVQFDGTVDGGVDLQVNAPMGLTTFTGNVGAMVNLTSLTTDAMGGTSIAGDVTTTGNQMYGDQLILGGAGDPTHTLTGAGATFTGGIDGDNVGAADSLNLHFTADITLPGAGLTGVNVLTVGLDVAEMGAANINGGITTSGNQIYNDNVVLTADAALNAGASTVTFNDTVAGSGAGMEALNITGNAVAASTVGTMAVPLEEFTVTGTTSLGGDVFTSNAGGGTGDQTYAMAVTLTGNVQVTTTGGVIDFQGAVDATGAGDETLRTTGAAMFGAAVGGGTPLGELTVDNAVSLGNDVTTSNVGTGNGNQNYDGNVMLVADVNLTSTGGIVSVDGAVTGMAAGMESLTVTGNATFGNGDATDDVGTGALPLEFVNVTGNTVIDGGDVATAMAQTYGDDAAADTTTVNENTTLTGTTVTFNSDLDGELIGEESVTVMGAAVFNGDVGGSVRLGDLLVTGTTDIAGNVATDDTNAGTGDQTYMGELRLVGAGDPTHTLRGVTATFAMGIDGNNVAPGDDSLELFFTGNITIPGAMGINDVADLTVGEIVAETGNVTIDGGISTSGSQTYNDDVVVSADFTLAGTDITFNGTLDSMTQDMNTLNVNGSGTTAFNGVVGGSNTQLLALNTDAAGATEIGATINFGSGTSTIGDAVTLTADVGINSLPNGDIIFAGTVDSDATPRSLTFNMGTGSATTTFQMQVGGINALSSFNGGVDGVFHIDGGLLEADDAIAFNLTDVEIGADATLRSNNDDNISISRGITGQAGSENLTIEGNFQGPIGASSVSALATLDVTGTTALRSTAAASVTTTGSQTYQGAVTLEETTTLTGVAIDFQAAVDSEAGENNDLTVNDSGATIFGGAVGAGAMGSLGTLATDATGTTAINGGSVTTTVAQNYNDATTIGAAATALNSGAGTITVSATGTLDINGNNTTLQADEIDFVTAASISDGMMSAALTLVPSTPATTIDVGGFVAGTLDISDTDIAALADGFSEILIGDANSGAVDINSSTFLDDLTVLGDSISVTELSSAGNTVSLTADTTNITDGGDVGNDVTATTANLTANLGSIGIVADAGADNAIETDVANLNTSTTGGGDQAIDETSGLTTLSMNAGAGAITLTTGGTVLDGDAAADIIASTFTGTIGGDFGATGGGDNMIDTTVANLNVDSSAATGDQWIDESDGLTTLNLNAGMGDVTLNAAGNVLDGDAAADIIASTFAGTIGGDFGATGGGDNMIDTTVANLNVDSSAATGDQWIDESDGLTTLNLNAGMGDVTLNAAGNVLDGDAAADIIASTFTGTIGGDFGATGGGDNMIDTTVANLNVDSSAATGDQWIDESDGLTTLNLNAGMGDVTLNAAGNVLDGDAAADIIASTFTGTIGGDFGATGGGDNMIDTTVANLNVDSSAATGDQWIDESDGLTTLNLNAGMGDVTLNAAGNVLDGDAAADIIASTFTGTIGGDFGATGGGDNMIDTTVANLNVDSSAATGDQWIDESDGLASLNLNAGMGDVTLNAAGNVLDGDDDTAADITAVTATVTLSAGNFGATGGVNPAIDTIATTLVSIDTSSADGDIFVNTVAGTGTGNLTINAGTLVGGDATVYGFTGGGDVTVTDSDTTTFPGAATIGVMTITDTTDTVFFQGDTTITTLTTFAQDYSVSFTGSMNSVATDTTFLNTGAGTVIVLGDDPTDTTAFPLGLDTQSAALTQTAGTVSSMGTQIDFGTLELEENTTVSSGAGAINFNGTVNSEMSENNNLDIDSSGNATFVMAVGTLQALGTVDTDATGSTHIDGGFITSVGTQTYEDDVEIGAAAGANTTLTAKDGGGTLQVVTFNEDVNGTPAGMDEPLIIDANVVQGDASGDYIGNTTPLASLSVTGTTVFNGGSATDSTVDTVGTQTYTGAVTLDSVGVAANDERTQLMVSTITFQSTVDANTSGLESLDIQGAAVFGDGAGDFVGRTTPLSSVNVTGSSTFFSGSPAPNPAVTTIGGQTYGSMPAVNTITLEDDTALVSTMNGDIVLNGVVDAAAGEADMHDLIVNTGGTTTFNGATLGMNVRLDNLTTDHAAYAGRRRRGHPVDRCLQHRRRPDVQ